MIDAGIKFPIRGDYTNFDAIENVLLYMFQIPTDRYPNRKPVPIHFYGIPYIGYPPKAEDVKPKPSFPLSFWHLHFQLYR